jgi:hypothetical protein
MYRLLCSFIHASWLYYICDYPAKQVPDNAPTHPHAKRLLAGSSRVARPINSTLNVPRDAVLACVELAADKAVLAEGAADRLADLSDGAVGVDCLCTLATVQYHIHHNGGGGRG